MPDTRSPAETIDMEAFRLRRFVDRLIEMDEVEIHDEPVPLIGMAQHLDGNAKAVLFRKAGPERAEVVGSVLGSRARIAAGFDVGPRELTAELIRRLKTPQPIVEVSSKDAPVHQVIWEGDDADITRLPAHLQHEKDGGPYISASIDYTIDPDTGWTNIGIRRLMLRSRTETGVDLLAPSDLRALYQKMQARGERVPVAFTIGAHPVDFAAASMRLPMNEIEITAMLRGRPLPVVKCRTSDIRVPADAEIVVEGWLDPAGYVEEEGPYGEFLGYYGEMKRNPVFHVTAITMRNDALFQTVTISGKHLGRTETAQLGSMRADVTIWKALETAVREPVAVYATPSSNGSNNARIAIRQRVPGEARNAIAAVMGCFANVKNVFVVDDDIDVFSDEQMDWALATRFQPNRDLVVADGFRVVPLDPSLESRPIGGKAGYDLTIPFGKRATFNFTVPEAPKVPDGPPRFQTAERALTEAGPMYFGELMAALASHDGREIVLALDELRRAGRVKRLPEGQWALKE